jgi:hypothetical protein
MRYTVWLWNQLEEDSPIGRFAKVCYDDVNNGCANARFSSNDWLLHFEGIHRENKEALIARFFTSFAAYNKSNKAE